MDKHLSFTCQDVKVCSAAFLDGQLSPSEEMLMEDHLAQCDACATQMEHLAEQQIQPPRIQLIQNKEYWAEMDAVLQEELERNETSVVKNVSNYIVLVAIILLTSLYWGVYNYQRAQQLEEIVLRQQHTIELLEKISVQQDNSATQKVLYIPAKMEL